MQSCTCAVEDLMYNVDKVSTQGTRAFGKMPHGTCCFIYRQTITSSTYDSFEAGTKQAIVPAAIIASALPVYTCHEVSAVIVSSVGHPAASRHSNRHSKQLLMSSISCMMSWKRRSQEQFRRARSNVPSTTFSRKNFSLASCKAETGR